MVHEEQHSHVRAHGGYTHPHHHTVCVWPHLQGGAGMIYLAALALGLIIGSVWPINEVGA